jgi:hypothetical protein
MSLTPTKNTPAYTAIGSRKTPQNILGLMQKIASLLALEGYTLRSGGAPGADSAFELGCNQNGGKKEIFLPWKGFNKNQSTLTCPSPEAYEIAQKIHPYWKGCKQTSKNLHARNIHQVLGENLKSPSQFVLFWADTSNGKPIGGTATAVNLARNKSIPTYNLKDKEIKDKWLKFSEGKIKLKEVLNTYQPTQNSTDPILDLPR